MAAKLWIMSGVGAALIAGAALAQGAAPAVERKVLQRSDAAAGQEAVQGLATFPPGSQTGRHTHPGVELGYVISGQLELTIDGQPPKLYGPGEAFLNPRTPAHNARNIGSVPAVASITWLVDKGAAMTTPAQ